MAVAKEPTFRAHLQTNAHLPCDAAERFEFTFTSKHGSWLNLIESFFGKMARTLLRRIRVTSADELKELIELYLKEVNETPVELPLEVQTGDAVDRFPPSSATWPKSV